MFDQLKNYIDLNQDTITISWAVKNVGWGQFTFSQKDDKLFCSSEGMNKEFVKAVLCDMVDLCIMEDE
jgi:hypothetical protein